MFVLSLHTVTSRQPNRNFTAPPLRAAGELPGSGRHLDVAGADDGHRVLELQPRDLADI
jgi:hypothetical protein